MQNVKTQVTQQEAARYLLKIKKAALSYPNFMDYNYPDFVRADFQEELVKTLDLLEKDELINSHGVPIRKLLITMPPRHAKSFYGTINFPAYCMMRDPTREIMVAGYNSELAATFGRQTREIVTNPANLKSFPKFKLSQESRAVDFWKTVEGGAYYAVGMGGTTTGRGANILIVDDPYKTREEADSTVKRNKIWDFYTASLLTRMQPHRNGKPPILIVTHTRWNPDDIGARIMESDEFKRGEWFHLNYPAIRTIESGVEIKRSDLPKDDPRYIPARIIVNGKYVNITSSYMNKSNKYVSCEREVALWPERFPLKELKKIRERIGDREFEALYQQNPYVLGGNIIKISWFKRYTPETCPTEFHAIVIGLDTAFKTKSWNDFSVITVAGITELGDIYILKVYREKLEYPDLKRKLVNINSVWRGRGLRGWYVEDAASGQSLIQDMRHGSSLTILPWKPGTNDKTNRCTSITPIIEGGRVFIPEEADWLDDWEVELSQFPSGKHDDQVDSLVIVIDVASKMVVTGEKFFNESIGNYIVSPDFKGDLMFGNDLHEDKYGWQGSFGQSLGEFASWGE
jgi:predicted phage terminase large subunit-like protein